LLDEDDKKEPRGADPVLRSLLLAKEGDTRGSLALIPTILKELNAQRMKPSYHHGTYDVAVIYAENGNAAEAVKWLRETAEKGNPSYAMFVRDTFLDRIRKSPEFVQFMAEMKPQWERYKNEFGGR
jgi:hypothetical protein